MWQYDVWMSVLLGWSVVDTLRDCLSGLCGCLLVSADSTSFLSMMLSCFSLLGLWNPSWT